MPAAPRSWKTLSPVLATQGTCPCHIWIWYRHAHCSRVDRVLRG
jgi:hypothetical protein